VLFHSFDEIEWIDPSEVEARESRFGNVVFVFVMDVALVALILVDSKYAISQLIGKSILVSPLGTWAVVIREILKAPTTAVISGELTIELENSNVHLIRIDDGKLRVPGRGIWIAKCCCDWSDNFEAQFLGKSVALTMKPGFVFR